MKFLRSVIIGLLLISTPVHAQYVGPTPQQVVMLRSYIYQDQVEIMQLQYTLRLINPMYDPVRYNAVVARINFLTFQIQYYNNIICGCH